MAGDKADGMAEKFIGWGMILLVVGVSAYIVYLKFTPEIHSFIRWIRYGEMWIIATLTPDDYMLTLPTGDKINIQRWVDSVGAIPKDKIDGELLSIITYIALAPFKWFFALGIGLIGLWTYTAGPGTHYLQVFNLDGFIRFQSKAFPVISPFAKFNPAQLPPRAPGSPVPAKLPLFAEALGPEEWLAYYQIPVPDGVVDEDAVQAAFTKQLGPRWRGFKKLHPYKQVLLAAFCLKAARKRDLSDKMMGRLARCWSHDEGLKLSRDKSLIREARKVLMNKELSHNVIKQCNQHAWETTALLRGLSVAREEGGVLAPAQFVWLRGHNRELWYPLNNLGRQSNHSEAIGAMCHFKAEKRAQRPIPKPKVEDAITSIVEYMKSDMARPIPTLDYSKSDKRGIKKLKTA